MDKIKNYLIALLTGLLALSVGFQLLGNIDVRNYDQVKVVQYERCLDFLIASLSGADYLESDTGGIFDPYLGACARYKP